MIIGISPELDGEAGRRLLIAIMRELQEKGYPLDCGSREFERIEKLAVVM